MEDTHGAPLSNVGVNVPGFISEGLGTPPYFLGGLPVGPYQLCANASDKRADAPYGFVRTCVDVVGVAGQTQTVNPELPIGGALSGTVTQNGQPRSVVNMTVRELDGTVVNATTQTDANGHFEVDQLAAGAYTVCTWAELTLYSETCFGETTTSSTSTHVTVAAAADTSGVDIQLLP